MVSKKKEKHLPDSLVAPQRNDLIHGQQQLTLIQKRIFTLVVKQINRDDKDFKTYVINVKDLVEAGNSKSIYNRLKDETKKLISKVLTKKENVGSKTSFTHWTMISKAHHTEGEGVLEINLHPDIRDMLLHLKDQGNFTPVPISELLACRSTYGQRIYELLYSWRRHGEWEVSVEDLRFSLAIEDKYQNYADFRRYVLEKAQSDIAKNTNMRFDWEEKKNATGLGSGRKITHIHFTFTIINDQIDFDFESDSGEKASDWQPRFKLLERLKKAQLNQSQTQAIIDFLISNPDLEKAFSSFFNQEIENVIDTGATDHRGKKIENIQAWAWVKIKNAIESESLVSNEEQAKKVFTPVIEEK